jgi:hypothetical protein
MSENYVYKKEVDWSLLMEGLALPVENQVVFGQIMGRFLHRGESKKITIYLDNVSYPASIVNQSIGEQFKRMKDKYQIRYARNGDLARALQRYFAYSYQYLEQQRALREPGDRRLLKLPEGEKEFLAIYTTEYDDSYIFEPIVKPDLAAAHRFVLGKSERIIEEGAELELTDPGASIEERVRIQKIRRLDRRIGENLKLLYGYRCQICGKWIGEEFSAHVVEAHHIDYFVTSLNNDASNQLIVCPNHHSIIHDVNPVFDRKRKLYLYQNGMTQGLLLNSHL